MNPPFMTSGILQGVRAVPRWVDGEGSPRCHCHNEPMSWERDVRKRLGGFWRCVVKERARDRKHDAIRNKRPRRQLQLRVWARNRASREDLKLIAKLEAQLHQLLGGTE